MIVKKVERHSFYQLTQIAFGITDIQSNPDFVNMLRYSREHGVIPNFTLTGIDLTDEMLADVVKYIGAVAVSAYQDHKDLCYNTVQRFVGAGIDQTNIHLLASQETLEFVYEVLQDIQTDPRLAKLNACVFLGVKNKGRAKDGFRPLTEAQYADLIKYCLDRGLRIGFDSCSAQKFERAIEKMKGLTKEQRKAFLQCSESCESLGLFSSYINVFGEYFFCSFSEGEKGIPGISVVDCDDFLKDVWYNPIVNEWRKKSLDSMTPSGCRKCLFFPEINIK